MLLQKQFQTIQMASIELISIGDELLIGQTINTNASWMGSEFASAGYKVNHVATISDTREAILSALKAGLNRSDVICITGGLGPTKDDITKHVLCEFFETELEINEEVYAHVAEFFEKRNRPMLEVNRLQAAVPKAAHVLFNKNGTAPGMWFEKDGKIVVSMPGVPYEMKGIFLEQVLPKVIERFGKRNLLQRTVLTQGIGESFLADRMSDWENRLAEAGFSLAYLPSPGMVKLRLTSFKGKDDEQLIQTFIDELKAELPKNVFGEGDATLTEVIGEILRGRNQTIGTVESCTAGKLAGEIASISGSSDYFLGGLLTYSNEMKTILTEVPATLIAEHGAVSQEVVEAMALGGLKKLAVDWCISTSGIAGPIGGTEDKPVGTIWIAVASKDKVVSKRFLFGDHRERNVQMTVLSALNLFRCTLLGINE